MIVVWLLLAAIAGLFAASVIWTLADKQIRGRLTHLRPTCLSCGEALPHRTWLPLSWLVDGGRCPNCGDSDAIPRRRWEIAVAVYLAAAVLLLDAGDSWVRLLIASLPLLLILAVDLKVQAVFLQACYLAVVVGLFLGLTESASEAADSMAGMAIAMILAAIFLLITRWLYRSLNVRTTPMGLTDLYIAAAAGAIVRADALVPAMVAAVLMAAAYGIVGPVLRPRMRSRLAPFGPFLCAGGLVALLL